MRSTTAAALAALEALVTVAIGIGIVLVPATLVWALQHSAGPSWLAAWRAAADLWLAGHGVDLRVAPGGAGSAALGSATTVPPFPITIAAAGFSLVTVLVGVRIGRRGVAAGHPVPAVLAALVAFAAASTLVTLGAQSAVARPAIGQGIVLPAVVLAVGLAIGAAPDAVRSGLARAPRRAAVAVRAAAAAGAASASLVLAAGAVLVAVVLAVRFASAVALYQGLDAGPLGATALTLGQLSLLPDAAVWGASWLVGPGFALGTGSGVSPFSVQLGPLPSLPLLAALPRHAPAAGWAAVLVPVAAGVVSAIGAGARARADDEDALAHPVDVASASAGAGVVAGVVLGALCWWCSGSLGPGRLIDAGPDPLLVGVVAAVEVAIASAAGLVVVRAARTRTAPPGRVGGAGGLRESRR